MSSPYVYTPHLYPALNPYVDAYFTQTQPSPFIPDTTLYPPSPYSSAPNTPHRVRFQELPGDFPPRARRPSWHGGETPVLPSVPFPQSPFVNSSPFLQAEPLPYHQRRHSFGTSTYQHPWSSFNTGQPYAPWLYPPQPNQFLIHPLLNAESPRPDFFFDLSFPKFAPVLWNDSRQYASLSTEILAQPATHPPITRMLIVCDRIPQWPIELEYNPYFQGGLNVPTPPVPITVSDVLVAIHRSLHTRISHVDWAKLSVSEETAVARSYTRRCKSVPSISQLEASQGVRRVDFLLDKVMFRGILRTTASADGLSTFKLVVG